MIARLDWEGFVTMVDLLLQRGGWQRRWMRESFHREQGNYADFSVVQPVLARAGSVAIVDVPSDKQFEKVLARFYRNSRFEQLFWISQAPLLTNIKLGDRVVCWSGDSLARRVIAAGLMDWVVDETLSHILNPGSEEPM